LEKEIIKFNNSKLSNAALSNFFRITCNTDKIITKEEMEIKKYIESNIAISSIYLKSDAEKNKNNELVLENDVVLHGEVFEIIGNERYEILLYIIVVNNKKEEKTTSILEKYYIDAWELAYLEAAEEALKERLAIAKYLSIGPGHERFPIENIKIIFDYLDGEKIKAELNEKNVMIPSKSVIKMVIVDDMIKINKQCEQCTTTKSCAYCSNYNDNSN